MLEEPQSFFPTLQRDCLTFSDASSSEQLLCIVSLPFRIFYTEDLDVLDLGRILLLGRDTPRMRAVFLGRLDR